MGFDEETLGAGKDEDKLLVYRELDDNIELVVVFITWLSNELSIELDTNGTEELCVPITVCGSDV